MAVVPWNPGNYQQLDILATESESDILDLRSLGRHGKWVIGIATGNPSFTGTIFVDVYAIDPNDAGAAAIPLHSSGVPVQIPVNSAQSFYPFPFAGLRLRSTAPEAASLKFIITGFAR